MMPFLDRRFRTPAIIGTGAAIDRAFFEEIGALDEEMELWGGENIDLSMRVRITRT